VTNAPVIRAHLTSRPIELALVVAVALAARATAAASYPEIYASLAASDLALATSTVQRALESNVSGTRRLWRNGRTGSTGWVRPLRTFRIRTGHYCREYEETIETRRGPLWHRAIACRRRQGGWQSIGP
jgi:surface antigen